MSDGRRGDERGAARSLLGLLLGSTAALVLLLTACSPSQADATHSTDGAGSSTPTGPTDDPSTGIPTQTAAASPSPSDPTAAPSDPFAEVDGTWCHAEDGKDCFTIALPRIDFPSHPHVDQYVSPPYDEPGDPSGWVYTDLAPGVDGCYETTTDGYPASSGAAFVYCPAGSISSRLTDPVGDSSVDRVFITQEVESVPFYRATD